ncbi:MAG: hypothetical protein ACTSRK_15035 [Promethearchaeota archaeon]
MTQFDSTTSYGKKISPEWGMTQYGKPGCASYRVADDVAHEKILDIVDKGTAKMRELRFMMKLKSTQCFNCLHLQDGTCTYSEDDIKAAEKKFKKTPILCRLCKAPFPNFHYFLLKGEGGLSTYTCESCHHAETNGGLSERLRSTNKKRRTAKGEEITSGIFIVLLLLLQVTTDFIENEKTALTILIIVAVILLIDFLFFMYFAIKSLKEVIRERREKKRLQSENK